MNLDSSARTIVIRPEIGKAVKYAWQMPDNNHLVVISTPPDPTKEESRAPSKSEPAFTPAVITMTRTPIPAHYPLLDRGFYLVNEWGLER